MTHLILYGILFLIAYLEFNVLVDEWRATRNGGGMLLGLAFIVFTTAVIGTAIGSVKP